MMMNDDECEDLSSIDEEDFDYCNDSCDAEDSNCYDIFNSNDNEFNDYDDSDDCSIKCVLAEHFFL